MEIRQARTKEAEGSAQWALNYLDVAAKEGHKILNDDQYEHVRQQFLLLAEEKNPHSVKFVDVLPIEDYFELRDKGGILGKINIRVYFAIVDEARTIVVLGCYKKEDEGQTPARVKVRMRTRMRHVLELLK